MSALRCFPLLFNIIFLGLLLSGCAASETRSLVSAGDLPPSKYRKVALFIENLEPAERRSAEQIVLSALRQSGMNASTSSEILRVRRNLSAEAQASLIRKEGFDAVLYVNVFERGLVEQPLENAWFDRNTGMIWIGKGILATGTQFNDRQLIESGYIVRDDGTVHYPVSVLKVKSELQDVKSAKLVWAAETVASGNVGVSAANLFVGNAARLAATDMTSVFRQAAKDIVDKLRADSAI